MVDQQRYSHTASKKLINATLPDEHYLRRGWEGVGSPR